MRRVGFRKEGKLGEERIALKSISDFVDRGVDVPREKYAKDNSRSRYKLHGDNVVFVGSRYKLQVS